MHEPPLVGSEIRIGLVQRAAIGPGDDIAVAPLPLKRYCVDQPVQDERQCGHGGDSEDP
jgi:hypothetical protein